MGSRETLTRIVLLALLLYAAVCLASVSRELHASEAVRAALADTLAREQRQSDLLQAQLESGWTAEEAEALARERLGLVRPEDRIFCFPAPAEPPTDDTGSKQDTVTETERIIHGFGSWRHQRRPCDRHHQVWRVCRAGGRPQRPGTYFGDCERLRQ